MTHKESHWRLQVDLMVSIRLGGGWSAFGSMLLSLSRGEPRSWEGPRLSSSHLCKGWRVGLLSSTFSISVDMLVVSFGISWKKKETKTIRHMKLHGYSQRNMEFQHTVDEEQCMVFYIICNRIVQECLQLFWENNRYYLYTLTLTKHS